MPFHVIDKTFFSGENGAYYQCDSTVLADNDRCLYTITDNAPEEWNGELEEHDISAGPCGSQDFTCEIEVNSMTTHDRLITMLHVIYATRCALF